MRDDPSDIGAASSQVDSELDRRVEESLWRALIPGGVTRRRFLQLVGAGAATALLESVFPLGLARALAAETLSPELKSLDVAFLPITCATPILMAQELGLYNRYGLDVTLRRATGWALVRDWATGGEVHAAHMLIPMPLAIHLGVDAQQMPFVVSAFSNTDGNAITLHKKYAGKVQGPQDMKGMRLCIPFRYSMHNYLLRYYLASGGVHPDRDVELIVVPPPEMLANLKAGNVDGYIVAEPFNQRAVYDGSGFLFMLTNTIWDGHPCCGLSIPARLATEAPQTFLALSKAMIASDMHCNARENRIAVADAISTRPYLNQPPSVVRQVLTGRFTDGRGEIRDVPDRIGFSPFPWTSMAVWILTQMKRWGHIRQDVEYAHVAEQVFLAAKCNGLLKEMGLPTYSSTSQSVTILGKTFDPSAPEAYEASFAIRNDGGGGA